MHSENTSISSKILLKNYISNITKNWKKSADLSTSPIYNSLLGHADWRDPGFIESKGAFMHWGAFAQHNNHQPKWVHG